MARIFYRLLDLDKIIWRNFERNFTLPTLELEPSDSLRTVKWLRSADENIVIVWFPSTTVNPQKEKNILLTLWSNPRLLATLATTLSRAPARVAVTKLLQNLVVMWVLLANQLYFWFGLAWRRCFEYIPASTRLYRILIGKLELLKLRDM